MRIFGTISEEILVTKQIQATELVGKLFLMQVENT